MDLKTVYYARDSGDAGTVKEWLKAGGIEASIYNDEGDALGFGMESGPQVLVGEEHFELAKAIVLQYEMETRDGSNIAEVSDAEGQFDWPVCPQCDELREASCEHCEYVGPEFGAPDGEAAKDNALCLSCNKVTQVQLQDRCRFCGHDFTQPANQSMVPISEASGQVNSNRVLLLVGGIGLVVAILAVWFAFFAQ